MRKWLIPVLVTIAAAPAAGADRPPAGVPLSVDGKGGVDRGRAGQRGRPVQVHPRHRHGADGRRRHLARELGAPVVATSELVTIAGSERRTVVRLDSIAVSPVQVDGVLAPVVPAAELASLGRGVRGLLGQDFLSAFNYTLDYRHARLTWDEALACSAPGAVRMQAAEGRFSMILTGESGAPLRVVPDSGAEVAVLFRPNGAPSGEAGRTTLRTLRIGDLTLRNVDAYLVERVNPDADGLLPLHGFSSVSFAAGGACLVARR